MANDQQRALYERAWAEPIPPRVSDGSAWYKLLLDTALKHPSIPTYVKVLSYSEGKRSVVSTYFETSRGDVIEVLSPVDAYPSKMLIETILLLY